MRQTDNSPPFLPATAVLLMVLLCLIWGGNLVSIKISNEGIPPIFGAAMRSIIAWVLLWVYASRRGMAAFFPPADLMHGVAIGFLFGMSFLFLYLGLVFTDVARSVIFIYTHPFWVAVAAHFLLPGERLTQWRVPGLILAFGGLVSVFEARSATLGSLYWLGDLMELAAALFWAATTVYIKRFVWNRPISPLQTLSAQLLFSIPVLLAGSLILERGHPLSLTPAVLSAFAYQVLVVAFFSYLLWFWMIHRYQVTRLSAFTFLSPLFGVLLSGLLLGESIPLRLYAGLALVATGLYVVNRPDATVHETIVQNRGAS
jgi:drug/metabolite transporter (DMT)-like permease